jgi:hypothetical protein
MIAMQRPTSLSVTAVLVAVQAAALGVYGIVELLRALLGHPHDRTTALLLGVLLICYAVGILFAARGVWLMRRWAQTPTYLVQFFSIVIGIGQIHTLPLLMVPLIAVSIATLIAVSLPQSRQALGGI